MRSMRTPILRSTLYCRSLLGCGFLFFGWAMPAWAQREVEVQFSGGISLTQPAIKRQNLPRNFRTPADINTAAALRVTFPISYWVGLGVEQRVTGLSQIIACRLPGLGRSTGIMSNTVHQSGISLRLYDLWTPGPKWGLDVALTGSYGWTSTPQGTYEGPLFYEGSVLTQPTRTVPLMLVRETNRKGGPMVGLEALLRYEWGLHHSLLLTATYQRGIQYYDKIRSTLVAYVDETRLWAAARHLSHYPQQAPDPALQHRRRSRRCSGRFAYQLTDEKDKPKEANRSGLPLLIYS
jgi:hypothetical protein